MLIGRLEEGLVLVLGEEGIVLDRFRKGVGGEIVIDISRKKSGVRINLV